MNASAWFNYFSFDVMGDFAFGKSFNASYPIQAKPEFPPYLCFQFNSIQFN